MKAFAPGHMTEHSVLTMGSSHSSGRDFEEVTLKARARRAFTLKIKPGFKTEPSGYLLVAFSDRVCTSIKALIGIPTYYMAKSKF